MFITAALVYVDAERGGMISASAGHCPLLFWGGGLDKTPALQAGYPLGIEPATTYRQNVHALPPGGAALLYTDGLSEARNAAGEEFGEARLKLAFAEASARSRNAETARDFLLRRLAEFRGQTSLSDDQTLILIRHQPCPP
jgi:serine phosphatase RsbU (regulator of sigma subunit)